MARHHLDVLHPVGLPPDLVRGPAAAHDAGLEHVGPVQLLLRAFEAEPADGHAEDLLGALEGGSGGGIAVVDLAAHPRSLDALAGEEKGYRPCQAYCHSSRVAP